MPLGQAPEGIAYLGFHEGQFTSTRPRRARLPSGLSPRLLYRDEAAAYCGISGELFERCVKVAPIKFGSKRRWDLRAIDHWLDQQMSAPDPRISGDFSGAANELRKLLSEIDFAEPQVPAEDHADGP